MSAGDAVLVVVAFLLGSIPFGYVLTMWRSGRDIRTAGSGNIGATNVFRDQGKALGAATLLLDFLKGGLAVGLALWFGTAAGVVAEVSAVAVVAGHCYTPFLRFRGGKGVATGAGVLAVLAPVALFGVLGVFVVVVAAGRRVSLGSICASAAAPVAAAWIGSGREAVGACLVLALLIAWRHRSNIVRLWKGTEPPLGGRGGVGRI